MQQLYFTSDKIVSNKIVAGIWCVTQVDQNERLPVGHSIC